MTRRAARSPGRNARVAQRGALDRAAWIAQGRSALIAGGIGAVRIGALARKLAVTRESFYWHFRDLAELHAELLRDWERGNSAAYRSLLERGRRDGVAEFRALVRLWLGDERYSPAWDAAIRAWARSSPRAARTLAAVDRLRIDVIRRMFLHMGYGRVESLVRARITYFHQVGYYAIDLGEPPARRARLAPVYVRILTGRPLLG